MHAGVIHAMAFIDICLRNQWDNISACPRFKEHLRTLVRVELEELAHLRIPAVCDRCVFCFVFFETLLPPISTNRLLEIRHASSHNIFIQSLIFILAAPVVCSGKPKIKVAQAKRG